MHLRIFLLSVLALALSGCPPLPPGLITCEEADACSTSEPASTSGDETPTTSDGVQTVTGDSDDGSSGSTAPAEETGDEPGSTTDQPVLPPQIVDGVVIPDYIDENGLLELYPPKPVWPTGDGGQAVSSKSARVFRGPILRT